ncbi:MAG: MFS transporter, partial [Spirochaetales bacterium]
MNVSRNIRMLILLLCILFLSMLSRLIFSPLLVFIQQDLSLTGKEAGSIFFLLTAGYSPGMLSSGFFSARFRHRGTILLALGFMAAGTFLVALCGSFATMVVGLLILGFGTGLYPPSGIASITGSIDPQKTGKALAVHELGPAFAFVAAPLLVVALYPYMGWRFILGCIALVNLVVAVLYSRYGCGGEEYGQTPRFSNLRVVWKDPLLWFCLLLFCVALSAMQGLYSILPFYLITNKNLEPTAVNLLVGLSRITGILTLLISGYLVDGLGARRVLMIAFAVSGVSTLGIMGGTGTLLNFFVVLQPALLSAFFPAGLLVLSRIGPPEIQNVTLSFVISFAVLFGNGIVPTLFGWLLDSG